MESLQKQLGKYYGISVSVETPLNELSISYEFWNEILQKALAYANLSEQYLQAMENAKKKTLQYHTTFVCNKDAWLKNHIYVLTNRGLAELYRKKPRNIYGEDYNVYTPRNILKLLFCGPKLPVKYKKEWNELELDEILTLKK